MDARRDSRKRCQSGEVDFSLSSIQARARPSKWILEHLSLFSKLFFRISPTYQRKNISLMLNFMMSQEKGGSRLSIESADSFADYDRTLIELTRFAAALGYDDDDDLDFDDDDDESTLSESSESAGSVSSFDMDLIRDNDGEDDTKYIPHYFSEPLLRNLCEDSMTSMEKKVRFGQVTVREHTVILNASKESDDARDCAIQLSWEHKPDIVMDLPEDDRQTTKQFTRSFTSRARRRRKSFTQKSKKDEIQRLEKQIDLLKKTMKDVLELGGTEISTTS
jgi:hypothetical protein